MQPFEIHIYAIGSSTSKFKEFTPSTTDSLPSDLIKHIDGVWGMFPVGTYAVYYTEQAYILTLFSNFSSEGQLSVAVSVALRRGYVLKYPMEILNDLCVEFRKLAGEHRNDPEIAMYNNMPILNELVAKGVVAVPNQPVYNYGTGQCAVVGYNSSEELLSLLKHPSRKEFQNITYLYLLPKHEAARRWNVLSASFKAITNIDFDYNRTYKLRYPDGYQEEISGIDHEVNRDCEKAYCEPIKLHGNLKDHMGEWQVALSEDNTTYQIGLQFKPLRETYEIVSKEKDKVLNGVQYSASVGTVEGNMLTLVGEQTAQTPVLALCSGQHFKIEKQEFIPLSKQIIVKLSPLYRYDVSALWNEVKQANGEDEGIVIALIDQEIKRSIHEFSKRDLSSYFDLPYSKAAFVVRETKRYKKCTIFINPDGTIQPGSYHPTQKECLKVTFYFQNEKVIQGFSEGKHVKLSYASESGSFDGDVDKSPYTIEGLPFEQCTFTIKAKGYRPFKVTKNYAGVDRPKSDVDFTDVIPVSLLTFLPLKGSNVKRLAIWLLSVAVAFLIGGAVGLFTRPLISDSNHGEQAEIVDSLSRTMNKLREKEEDLRLKDENACLKDSVKKLTEQIAKTVDKAKGPKPEPEQNVDAERASLIKKLCGTAFTKADIEKLKQKQPTNEEKKLIRSCEACLRLINYDMHTKDRVVRLIKDRELTGVNDHDECFIKHMYHNIIDVHKKAMDKIIKDYSKAY